MPFSDDILDSVRLLHRTAIEKSYLISTAESCTGGLLMAALTEIPGASQLIWQGLITYHNHSKEHWLAVTNKTLTRHGAVSGECAAEMLQGILIQAQEVMNMQEMTNMQELHANQNFLGIAITGIAGDDTDNDAPARDGQTEKATGLVYIGCGSNRAPARIKSYQFKGNRHEVRMQSVQQSLQNAQDYLKNL